jgi:hypothetical protein
MSDKTIKETTLLKDLEAMGAESLNPESYGELITIIEELKQARHLDLKVYFNESEYFIATSVEEATGLCIISFGSDYHTEDNCPFKALPPEHKMGIMVKDGKVSDGGTNTEKTCAEWIKFHGPGYLASVEF